MRKKFSFVLALTAFMVGFMGSPAKAHHGCAPSQGQAWGLSTYSGTLGASWNRGVAGNINVGPRYVHPGGIGAPAPGKHIESIYVWGISGGYVELGWHRFADGFDQAFWVMNDGQPHSLGSIPDGRWRFHLWNPDDNGFQMKRQNVDTGQWVYYQTVLQPGWSVGRLSSTVESLDQCDSGYSPGGKNLYRYAQNMTYLAWAGVSSACCGGDSMNDWDRVIDGANQWYSYCTSAPNYCSSHT